MSFKKLTIIFTISFHAIISFSCSLNYSETAKNFEKKPNFVFKKAHLDQYENYKPNLQITFDELEIYDTDEIWAGKKMYFSKLRINTNNNDEIESDFKGYAGIIKIDEKNNKYLLGKNVFFEDVKEGLIISGNAFFWDKKANILYGTQKGSVNVKKTTEFNIEGSSFIANTLSKEFEFIESITGNIKTEMNTLGEKKDDVENEQ